MNTIKRFSGFLWMLLGVAVILFMIQHAAIEINNAIKAKKAVLDTKIFWFIIIPIFTPVMLGLCLFGWYAWKGEYDQISKDSAHL